MCDVIQEMKGKMINDKGAECIVSEDDGDTQHRHARHKPDGTEEEEDECDEQQRQGPELDPAMGKVYRSLVARMNYLAVDRTDLQHCTRRLAKGMSRPLTSDWVLLKGVGRYQGKL